MEVYQQIYNCAVIAGHLSYHSSPKYSIFDERYPKIAETQAT